MPPARPVGTWPPPPRSTGSPPTTPTRPPAWTRCPPRRSPATSAPTPDRAPLQPPSPAGGGHDDPGPSSAGGWTSARRPPRPEVARLLAMLANAGSVGLTVTEIVVATGRQKTWVYDRLTDLQQAGEVQRASPGHYHLA